MTNQHPDFRALCADLVDVATAHCHPDDDAVGYCAAVLARAASALAQPTTRLYSYKVGEAEPIEDWGKGHTLVSPDAANAEAQPVPADLPVERVVPGPQGPTDKELLELMPESMRDEFSYAARVCSDATGRRVKTDIFRVALNTVALEYARTVLARWGRPTSEGDFE